MSVPCNRCQRPLPQWELAKQDAVLCPECGASSTVRVFPALFYASAGPVRTEVAAQGEAACFDHPSKRAVASCSHCGRFVCQLCAVEFRGGVWCPSCFTAAGRSGETAPRAVDQAGTAEFENSRTLYDSIALTAALAPLLIWFFTFLTAPVAVYLAVRSWTKPTSLVRRWRWRSVLALLIALGEIAAWIWGTAYFVLKAGT